jgi:hypothetical protein
VYYFAADWLGFISAMAIMPAELSCLRLQPQNRKHSLVKYLGKFNDRRATATTVVRPSCPSRDVTHFPWAVHAMAPVDVRDVYT